MNKTRITRFISKYNLAGLVESVTWTTDGQKLSTKFIADDKTVLGEITLDNFNFENAELGIYTTSNLNKMLSVLGDDVNLEVQKIEDKSIALGLGSDDIKAAYQLADLSVIPNVPELKQLPPFDIEIDLDGKFIDKFIKAKNALSDVDTFTVLTEKGNLNIVMGYSNVNSNRITFKAVENYTNDVKAISFSAKYLKEILTANKEATSAKLLVSSKGLAHISFIIDDFVCKYFLVEVQLSA
jgi:hypothetical protein